MGRKWLWAQRYQCLECRRTFTADLKYGTEIKHRAAEMYFDREASYRAVGRALGVKAHTVLGWINEMGARCKTFGQVARELKPKWGGWLLADGKSISVKGIEHALLLTTDTTTKDIPLAALAPSEDEPNWRKVFLQLRDEVGYPLKGLIVDGFPAPFAAARDVFPGVPVQICLRHAQEQWPRYFKYWYKGPTRGIPALLELISAIVHVRNAQERDLVLREWQARRPALVQMGIRLQVERVEQLMPHYFAFLDHPGMLPTNGMIEGLIRQLGRKIHDTDGYWREDNAWNSLKLLIMRYRFHVFACSRIPGNNGLSPLNLAGVRMDAVNWIAFSQPNN